MKVLKVEFSRDITLKPLADRWYEVQGAWTVDYITDCGRIHIMVDDGFMFDGRSGSAWIDALGIAPNLGSQEEMKAFLCHDLLYYDIGFTFDEANELLYSMLRQCGYGWFRSRLIYNAVSLFGKDHFGLPTITDREYPNITKIHYRHYDK
jgi:hypothetical protein